MRECSLFFCFLLDVVAAPNTELRVQEASDVLRQRIQVKVCMQTHCWLQQEIAACVQQTPVPPRQCQDCARKHTVPGLCNKHLCHQDSAKTVPGNTLCQDCATKTPVPPRQCQDCARKLHMCATNTCATKPDIIRVGQNRIYTPYMTVHFVISLPKVPYIHRIYMVLANPRYYARD